MSKTLPFFSFSLFAALTLVGATACTLFAPGEKQDGVQRCGSEVECGVDGLNPDDNRFGYVCASGTDQASESKNVCAPAYRSIKCGFNSDSGEEYENLSGMLASLKSEAYLKDCTKGKIGCAPDGGSCSEGEVVELGKLEICAPKDDESFYQVEYKAMVDAGLDPEKIFGLDLRNQFCAWYFCDSNFVCETKDADQGGWICKRCNPEASPDEGGCVTVQVGGKDSSIYVPITEENCNAGESEFNDVVLGTAPEAPKK